MKSYWQSLKDHPGTGIAVIFTLMGGLAGVEKGGWHGFLFGASIAGAFCWIPVLVTAWQMRKKENE